MTLHGTRIWCSGGRSAEVGRQQRQARIRLHIALEPKLSCDENPPIENNINLVLENQSTCTRVAKDTQPFSQSNDTRVCLFFASP